jgi:hypothetical protein
MPAQASRVLSLERTSLLWATTVAARKRSGTASHQTIDASGEQLGKIA